MKSPIWTNKWKRFDNRYADKEWSVEEIAAFEDAIAAHGPELQAYFRSSKLGEENLRILEHGVPVKPPGRQYKNVAEAVTGQRVGLADEGLAISHPSKMATCGMCRTRDSRTWWKAPKGLSASILCDTCGTNWRKYADLNVRPVREESLPATTKLPKAVEKREGTPLAGSASKHPKVDVRVRAFDTPVLSVCRRSNSTYGRSQERPAGEGFEPARRDLFLISPQLSAIVGPESVASWIRQDEETQNSSLLCLREGEEGGIAPAIDSYLHVR
ncbi:hypothetical protein C8J57DRAFT_1722799 [Mycena rebaudengoi]|nr:hypothetical protein C8J57DRAFT_1722799 [Mycena rebaudengoi]